VTALRGGEERDPDGRERDGHEEPDQPPGVEQIREDAAEEACPDSDERCRKQADLLPAWENESPQCVDDQPGENEPKQLERKPDQRP
jgi:hypothetical protein